MAAKTQTRACYDHLPHELWRDILNKLPAKSILRFRSVCKSLYSLVSWPNFISDYSIINKNGNRLLLQLHDRGAKVCSYSSYVESLMECREHDDLRGRDLAIVGSCNGLICLSNGYDFSGYNIMNVSVVNFVIWNPTIRKIVELPSRTTSQGHHFSYLGFGFDSKTNDYKVLCAVKNFSENNSYSSDAFVSMCEIFDSRNGVWRDIGSLVTSWTSCNAPQCYLNGSVHWIGYRRYRRCNTILVSFDMSDEVFRVIRMPDAAELTLTDADNTGSRQTSVCQAFDGLIHVILWKKNHSSETFSVWAMKEYGITESWTKVLNIDMHWTKLFNIDMTKLSNTDIQSAHVMRGADPRRFRLWKNDEVFIAPDQDSPSKKNRELSLYNTESKTCKHLSSLTKCISSMCLYEESLALM